MKKKIFAAALCGFLTLGSFGAAHILAYPMTNYPIEFHQASASPNSFVNWSSAVIEAEGEGIAPPTAINPAQARILARRAAVLDAYRQLGEFVQGVQIEAGTTTAMAMVASDTTNARVHALIRGANIVSEGFTSDGSYKVRMQLPLFGSSNSLASAVLPRHDSVESFPAPPVPVEVSGTFTGLVVDCRGLGLNPVMSPVIRDEQGTPIYGYRNLDCDFVVREGMASYAYDISASGRAGTNPLVVRAIALDQHNANPVVSAEDASRILSENRMSHFLDRTAVVFLR